MTQSLQQEYIELTVQLQEITRRRNEVGELLQAQRREETRTAYDISIRDITRGLIAVGENGDWQRARELLGVSDARLPELFHNVLRRVRTANPGKEREIPTRIGPRTLAEWQTWGQYVKRYLKTLPAKG